jgi:hypothetical protein
MNGTSCHLLLQIRFRLSSKAHSPGRWGCMDHTACVLAGCCRMSAFGTKLPVSRAGSGATAIEGTLRTCGHASCSCFVRDVGYLCPNKCTEARCGRRRSSRSSALVVNSTTRKVRTLTKSRQYFRMANAELPDRGWCGRGAISAKSRTSQPIAEACEQSFCGRRSIAEHSTLWL